jgi:hypothetical protein
VSEPVVVKGVVLRGDDLKVTWSAWSSLNRANNQRLFPVALGAVISISAVASLFRPTMLELLLFIAPLSGGALVCIWMTNALYLGAYRKGYENSATGAAPCDFTFDSDGMRQESPHYSSAFKWTAFADVREDAGGFRFWMTPFTAVFLPIRYLSQAEGDALRALIADARANGRIKGLAEE